MNSGASTNLRVYGIAGGAVGGMLILAFLIFAIILCKKRRGIFHFAKHSSVNLQYNNKIF